MCNTTYSRGITHVHIMSVIVDFLQSILPRVPRGRRSCQDVSRCGLRCICFHGFHHTTIVLRQIHLLCKIVWWGLHYTLLTRLSQTKVTCFRHYQAFRNGRHQTSSFTATSCVTFTVHVLSNVLLFVLVWIPLIIHLLSRVDRGSWPPRRPDRDAICS